MRDFSNNRAIAILRVSSSDQEVKISLINQDHMVSDYCQSMDIELVKKFNVVESAKDSSNRVQYRNALNYALENDIYNLVFYMDDREARNTTDVEENSRLVKAGRIAIHFARDKRVFDHSSPDSEYLLRDLNAVINKDFSRRLSTKVLDAYLSIAKNGRYPHSSLPLGYVWTRPTRSSLAELHLSDNEQDLDYVRSQFKLRAEGFSLRHILEESARMFSRKNYTLTATYKRLRNELYWGNFKFRGEIIQGNHPVFIDIDLLKRVREINETSTRSQRSKTPPIDPMVFLFGGDYAGHEISPIVKIFDPKYLDSYATFREKIKWALDEYRWSKKDGLRVTRENPYYEGKLTKLKLPSDYLLCRKYTEICDHIDEIDTKTDDIREDSIIRRN